MSSLEYTYQNIDNWIDRRADAPVGAMGSSAIDPARTALLVMDMQKLIVDPAGAGYVESVGGAPAGKDVVEPTIRVIEACRSAGVPVIWSLWGLRPDGYDRGQTEVKWPGLNPGTPQSPVSWGNGDAELDDAMDPREGEPVIYKHRFSSCYNTALDEYLRKLDAESVVIVGVTSANCVHATSIDLWNKDYKVVVCADCTTAIPHSGTDQPLGTGQHWEALRNIQLNYGDVLLSTELIDKLSQARQASPAAATAGS